ncbi:ABC-2 type transport system permease protein [Geomicrobium halophilum]|uniref:ABC-2 type transport system permease protein n=1 Tax=Geomicrobium halophilum TaxID=549000 RepID=A0A841Q0F1_9BACL|nr:hypothetical protein [Geomicrobium halophilum]MBB6450685.1 ABC-2 type transport system permease protein [Geomicrobium halophilum]
MLNKALFKKDLRLSAVMLLVLSIIFVVQYPLRTILELDRMRGAGTGPLDMGGVQLQAMFGGGAAAMPAFIGTVILGGMLIGLERNTRRHDFSLSLPYSRQTLFLIKATIGWGAITILFSVNVWLAYAIIWSSEYSSLLANFNFWGMFVSPLVAYLAIFSFTLFMGSISGEMISQVVLSFIFMIFPYGFVVLLGFFMTTHNITMEFLGTIPEDFLAFFINLMLPYQVMGIDITTNQGLLTLITLIFTFVCLFLGTKLYEKGKSERNGEFLLFSSLRPVFFVGIIGCFALLGGMIFSTFGGVQGGAVIPYWLGALIFGGLSYMITKRLLQMNITMKNH